MPGSRSKAIINNLETFWVKVSDQAVGSYSEQEPMTSGTTGGLSCHDPGRVSDRSEGYRLGCRLAGGGGVVGPPWPLEGITR